MSYNTIDSDEEERKLYCGNLSDRVTEDILYELFLQAGPLEKISMPLDRNGSFAGYAFVTFKHACSVPYAIELFEDTSLFGNFPKLRARNIPNHHRTQSMPIRFGQKHMDHDNGNNSQMDFDSLLHMSTSMLNTRGPPMEMGPPMGPMPRAHSMGRGPQLQTQPPPPGEEEPGDDQPWNESRDASRDKLTHSSLQGNWSTRNLSHMLPDDNKRKGHNSRRDYENRGRREHRNWDDSGYRGGGYHQGGYDRNSHHQGGYGHSYDQGGYGHSYDQGGYDQSGYNRAGHSNHGNYRGHRNKREDNGGYRSRSNDPRERRGRY